MKQGKKILTKKRTDRRILSNIPDPDNIRNLVDRRGAGFQQSDIGIADVNELFRLQSLSSRYMSRFQVNITRAKKKKKVHSKFYSEDISATGILIYSNTHHDFELDEVMTLRFEIPGGAMPEGFESNVKVKGKVIRTFTEEVDGEKRYFYAYEFLQPLTEYMKKKRWGLSIFTASFMLLLISFIVILMRAESIIYFKFNKFLYFYSIIAATFLLSRYLFGMFYRNVPINPTFEPGVSIIIPVFNEEKWIHRTILSCMDQYYPIDKLEVIVIDDCSTDNTLQRAKETAELIYEQGERFKTKERLQIHQLPQNGGKREALMAGVHMSTFDVVVFVDSDSFLEPNAIRNLVQPL